MPLTDRIVVDPKILAGKPVVRGTRISVDLVVELLAAGWGHKQVLASYPHLSEEDVQACLEYEKGLGAERRAAFDRIVKAASAATCHNHCIDSKRHVERSGILGNPHSRTGTGRRNYSAIPSPSGRQARP